MLIILLFLRTCSQASAPQFTKDWNTNSGILCPSRVFHKTPWRDAFDPQRLFLVEVYLRCKEEGSHSSSPIFKMGFWQLDNWYKNKSSHKDIATITIRCTVYSCKLVIIIIISAPAIPPKVWLVDGSFLSRCLHTVVPLTCSFTSHGFSY